MSTAHKTASEAILFFVATLVVALRFHARKTAGVGWKADDWLSLAAWVLFAGYVSGLFWGKSYCACRTICKRRAINNITGTSQHLNGSNIAKMPLPKIIKLLKLTFANIYLMSLIITFSRLSIIFLYHRLFGVYAGFRRALWAMGALTIAWVIMIIFLNTFRCRPTALAYNPLLKGKCLNMTTLFVATESLNCGLDLALVLLPLWRISFLHLCIRDRIGLGLAFLTGGFVCVTSILRIVFTYNIDTTKSAFWLTLQLAFAVICSCLPTLRAYLPKRIPTPTSIFSVHVKSSGDPGSVDHLGKSSKDSSSEKSSSRGEV